MHTRISNRVRRTGFTITELIVAVGVSVLLMLAVGQIFATTRKTISTGEASAQLTQFGRTMERLLRNDFDNMVRQGRGYLVIRNERLGSGNDVQSRDNQRRAVYFNADGEEAGEDMGTRRLDQLVFFTNGHHSTYQYRDPTFGQENIIARNDSAPVARVWWGHGLRDPNPNDTLDGIKRTPGLQGYDALFADPRSGNQVGQQVDLSNRYASNWILARQSALLLTREATDTNYNSTELELNFAPSAIEIFNEADPYWSDNRYFYPPPYAGTDRRRRFSAGYVDLIDQELEEAIAAVTEYGRQRNRFTGIEEFYADPLRDLYPNLAGGSIGGVDWRADISVQDPPRGYITDQVDQSQLQDINEVWVAQQRFRMMYSTGRMRVESAVSTPDRFSQMLTHATLVPGCSNFEVAWSTGEVNYPEGELVWFDINNPANPYAFHPGKTNREVDEQTPSDARVWYLSEILPPGSGVNDNFFSVIPNQTEYGREDLYYAVFGLFVPVDGDQTRRDAWPWPKLIRVRATLHDPQGRIEGGRDFEFFFNIPESADSIGS